MKKRRLMTTHCHSDPTPLDLLKSRARAVGLDARCGHCRQFRVIASYCELHEDTAIADGICLEWEADPTLASK